MKNSLASVAFVIISLSACSSNPSSKRNDYFEGRIIYNCSFKIRRDNLDTTFLRSLIGHSSTFYFKGGNYRQDYDLSNLKQEIYLTKENKCYFKKNNSDTLYWKEMSKPEDKVLKFELTKNKETFHGINCDELVIYYSNKIKRYYFNADSLTIDPDSFKNFKYYNKNFVTEKMGSLFLKCEIEYPQFIAVFTAVSITKEALNNDLFKIPSTAILKEDK